MHALHRITGQPPLRVRADKITPPPPSGVQITRTGHRVRLMGGRLQVRGSNTYGRLGALDEHGDVVPFVETPRYIELGEPIRELLYPNGDATFVITETGRLFATGIHVHNPHVGIRMTVPGLITVAFRHIPLPAPVRQTTGNFGTILLETGTVWRYGRATLAGDVWAEPTHILHDSIGQYASRLALLSVTHPAPVVMLAATPFTSLLLTADGTVHIAGRWDVLGLVHGRYFGGLVPDTQISPLHHHKAIRLREWTGQRLHVVRLYAHNMHMAVVDKRGRLFFLGRVPYLRSEPYEDPVHVPMPAPVLDVHLANNGAVVRCRTGRYMIGRP